jgi:hypothetical protein
MARRQIADQAIVAAPTEQLLPRPRRSHKRWGKASTDILGESSP